MRNFSTLVAKSVQSFDASVQDLILLEEMSELSKELLKKRRGVDNDDNIKEEMCHVLTSLLVVKTILGITDEDIDAEAKRKLEKYGWFQQEGK